MRTFTPIALAATAAIACAAAPVLAQSQVQSQVPSHAPSGTAAAEPPAEAKPVSKADQARIARCKSFPDHFALKNPTCVALMKKPDRPDASSGDDRDAMPSPQPSFMADRLP